MGDNHPTLHVNQKILTSQNLAPYLGGGESQNLYRFLVPPAQVVEHGVHSLQLPHFPVSVSEKNYKTIFFLLF